MTSPRYAKLASQALSKAEEVALPAPTLDARARAVEAIAKAIRERSKRRGRVRVLWAAGAVAAAAAVVALGVGLSGRHTPAPVVASVSDVPRAVVTPAPLTVIGHSSPDGAMVAAGPSGAATTPLVDGAALGPGSRIVARPGAHAVLAFSTGTRLTLDDGGELTLVDEGPTQVLALSRGSMNAEVAKLGARERFLIRTDDAEVEVRGTSFRVERVDASSSCDGSATRVRVFEGVVVVRQGSSESRVGAGEVWPACTASLAVAPKPAPGARDGKPHAAPALHEGARAEAPRATSSLADQNDLFGAAVSAKRAGDAPLALRRFDTFLARFPRSPLAESAEVQRMKLLRAVDPASAVVAARAYLAHHPDGFASDEARAILTP